MIDRGTARGALAAALSGVADQDALGTLTDLVEAGLDAAPCRTTRQVLTRLVALLREEAGGHTPRVWLGGETPPPDTTVLACTGDILRWSDEDTAGGTAGGGEPARESMRLPEISDAALTTALVEVVLPDWRGAVDNEVVRRASAVTRVARVPALRPVPPGQGVGEDDR